MSTNPYRETSLVLVRPEKGLAPRTLTQWKRSLLLRMKGTYHERWDHVCWNCRTAMHYTPYTWRKYFGLKDDPKYKFITHFSSQWYPWNNAKGTQLCSAHSGMRPFSHVPIPRLMMPLLEEMLSDARMYICNGYLQTKANKHGRIEIRGAYQDSDRYLTVIIDTNGETETIMLCREQEENQWPSRNESGFIAIGTATWKKWLVN